MHLNSIISDVLAWERHSRRVENLQAEKRSLPWWGLVDGLHLSRALKEATAAQARYAQRFTSADLHRMAELMAIRAWHSAAQHFVDGGNKYGPIAEANIDAIALNVHDRLHEGSMTFPEAHFGLASLESAPSVLQLLTPDFIKATAREEIDYRKKAAASDEFLRQEGTAENGDRIMTVQHKQSGLRAIFTDTQDGFGGIYSKPYRIASIDPDNPGPSSDWERFAGLGIGTRLYRQGASIWRAVRWRSHTASPAAVAVRRKLHREDPYRWEARCDWCTQVDETKWLYWEKRTRAEFSNHP